MLILFCRRMSKKKVRQWRKELERAESNEKEYNRIREALLDGLSKGQTTLDGDTQHEKLEVVEKAIIENLKVKQDLEVILATYKK